MDERQEQFDPESMHRYLQHMNIKRLIILIFGTIVSLAVVAIVLVFYFSPTTSNPNPVMQNTVTLPSSGNAFVPVTGTLGSVTTMTVRASGTGSIVTNDFIHNGVTIPDTANKGRYLLAGDLGYCVINPADCKAGSTTDYNIIYDSISQSFTIALLAEPIGHTRLEVERFLIQTLGITQDQMCKFDYYVGTTYLINSFYSSKNLGFSFCPGATKLPQ